MKKQSIKLVRPRGLPNNDVDADKFSLTNDWRAKRALKTVEFYHSLSGGMHDLPGEYEYTITDLLADLGHLCDRTKQDLQDKLRSAAGHYNAETQGKGVQFTCLEFDSTAPASLQETGVTLFSNDAEEGEV